MENIQLTKKTIDVMERRIKDDSALRLQNKLSSLGAPVTITNTGVVSSGKSSLFNALLDKADGERFSVGAARTTTDCDVEQLTDKISIVDTPGIDIKQSDDETALNSILKSSIIVMIHNIRMGMLHNNEVNWLKKIASGFSSAEEIKDRFVFVCTWIDGREKDETYSRTIEDTKRILFDIMGVETDFYTVSSTRFQTGKAQGKDKLIELSGVLQLKEALIKKAEYFMSHYGDSHIRAEIMNICENSKAKLKIACSSDKTACKAHEAEVEKIFKSSYETWSAEYKRYLNMHNEYVKIRNEITQKKSRLY